MSKQVLVILLHAAAADVGLVGENQGSADAAYGDAVSLIVIADGADDRRDVSRRNVQLCQNLESHERSGLTVIDAVDDISDVVQPGGGESQIDGVGIVPECLQDAAGPFSDDPDMSRSVLGVPQRFQRLVLAIDIDFGGFEVPDPVKQREPLIVFFFLFVLLSHKIELPFSFTAAWKRPEPGRSVHILSDPWSPASRADFLLQDTFRVAGNRKEYVWLRVRFL